ncbi:unnamed protein product [Prunus armeniaca]
MTRGLYKRILQFPLCPDRAFLAIYLSWAKDNPGPSPWIFGPQQQPRRSNGFIWKVNTPYHQLMSVG